RLDSRPLMGAEGGGTRGNHRFTRVNGTRTMRFLKRGLFVCAAVAAACSLGGAGAGVRVPGGPTVEVVAHVRWRYHEVLNGFSVVLRSGAEGALARVPGVTDVYESARYGPSLDQSGP